MEEISREHWLRARAYELWQYRKKANIPEADNELLNWYDAEMEWDWMKDKRYAGFK